MRSELDTFTALDRSRLQKFNWADRKLYDFFKQRLKRELLRYDQDEVDTIIAQIELASARLEAECIKPRRPKRNTSGLVFNIIMNFRHFNPHFSYKNMKN